jgi:putative (di)nucleoside polyphosphate hydrolase
MSSRRSSSPDPSTFFRAGVGACIVNGRGAILVLDRADVAEPAWQMPQGGIDPDERPVDALVREVREETGLDAAAYEVVAETEWLVYELPEAYWNRKVGRGQAQRWFLCRATSVEPAVRPDGEEFRAFQWVAPRELLALAAPFRRPVYQRILDAFAHALDSKEM